MEVSISWEHWLQDWNRPAFYLDTTGYLVAPAIHDGITVFQPVPADPRSASALHGNLITTEEAVPAPQFRRGRPHEWHAGGFVPDSASLYAEAGLTPSLVTAVMTPTDSTPRRAYTVRVAAAALIAKPVLDAAGETAALLALQTGVSLEDVARFIGLDAAERTKCVAAWAMLAGLRT